MEEHNMQSMHKTHYRRLILMAVLSFAAMYILMYAMVNAFGDVFANINQFYMAGLMTAPMVVIEILLMGMMYPNKKLNALIVVASIILGAVFFIFIRQQIAVSNRQFLQSMIPHHSGAILMCEQASIDDPEILNLCETIISSQQAEINQMKAMLDEIE